jgi:hypothetical protein
MSRKENISNLKTEKEGSRKKDKYIDKTLTDKSRKEWEYLIF